MPVTWLSFTVAAYRAYVGSFRLFTFLPFFRLRVRSASVLPAPDRDFAARIPRGLPFATTVVHYRLPDLRCTF